MHSGGGFRTIDAPSASELRAESLGLLSLLRWGRADEDSEPAGSETVADRGTLPTFEQLLRLYHKKIYSLIYRLLGDMDEAADLTQETFVKAYKAYGRFRGVPGAVYPWLCRIAVNNCKNKFKEASRRDSYEIRSLDEPIDIGRDEVVPDVPDGTGDPAGIVQRQELESKIQESIDLLPPEYRVVVLLRDMHGLTYKEISDATGVSLELVKARLFRARGLLRRRLSPYLTE